MAIIHDEPIIMAGMRKRSIFLNTRLSSSGSIDTACSPNASTVNLSRASWCGPAVASWIEAMALIVNWRSRTIHLTCHGTKHRGFSLDELCKD